MISEAGKMAGPATTKPAMPLWVTCCPIPSPVHKVSIIPRGRAGGYTLLLPKEDRYYMTKSQLLDQVTMLLGGVLPKPWC